MERRDFIVKTAGLAGTALAASFVTESAFAASGKKGGEHAHHQGSSAKGGGLAESAANCQLVGEICLQHCLDMLSSGNKSMVECTRTVRETILLCGALSRAAAQESKHLRELARISLLACRECEEACLKHKDMAVCKACADACKACAEECKKAMA